MRRSRLALPMLIALVIAACGQEERPGLGSSSDGQQTAIIYRPEPLRDGPAAHVEGVLGGDPKTGCLWLGTDPKVSRPIRIMGPYTVSWAEGLRLYKQGEEYGREGKVVGFRAGGTYASVPNCPLPGPSALVW